MARKPRTPAAPALRTRITGLEYVRGADLKDHAGNWRTHPQHQRDALGGVLREVGIAGALLAYHSERQGGLTIIDGHLRKGDYPEQTWPVLLTDLTDAEADYLLLTYDYLTYQAEAERQSLATLMESVQSGEAAVQYLVNKLAVEGKIAPPEIDHATEWAEMPEFVQEDQDSWKQLIVHFQNKDDLDAFAELIRQSLTERTKYIWFPPQEREPEGHES